MNSLKLFRFGFSHRSAHRQHRTEPKDLSDCVTKFKIRAPGKQQQKKHSREREKKCICECRRHHREHTANNPNEICSWRDANKTKMTSRYRIFQIELLWRRMLREREREWKNRFFFWAYACSNLTNNGTRFDTHKSVASRLWANILSSSRSVGRCVWASFSSSWSAVSIHFAGLMRWCYSCDTYTLIIMRTRNGRNESEGKKRNKKKGNKTIESCEHSFRIGCGVK